ncbi:GrpB family protein [Bacillus weihaiensis]|uniref:GrpB family protein n=1 Tax=Bacillus weihaiensis TaxID=1547283 RepID=UPI0023558DB7|nr:GrpB family protein [Bacillus weihaiensis]
MKIDIFSYHNDWPHEFVREATVLKEKLNHISPVIEHIGSTSVKDLAAKPIIDIMIGVKNEEELDQVVDNLMESDYIYLSIYNKQLPFRRFFIGIKKGISSTIPNELHEDNFFEIPHANRHSHIHVVPTSSSWWEDHLLFRDFLRVSEHDRKNYELLKRRLASNNWGNMNEYAQAKGEFIHSILEKARKR